MDLFASIRGGMMRGELITKSRGERLRSVGGEVQVMAGPCFFMLCTDHTEGECVERLLFGDRASQFDAMKEIQAGDFGFLLNMTRDELLGVFRAAEAAGLNIERGAWRGQFPAQIRARQFGELRRIAGASSRLAEFIELKVLGTGGSAYLAPAEKTYGPDVTEKVLSLFGLPTS
jgi:hypothetical protein